MPRALPSLLTLAIALLACRPVTPRVEGPREPVVLAASDEAPAARAGLPAPPGVELAPVLPSRAVRPPAPCRRRLADPAPRPAPACGSSFVLRDAPLLL